jgi:glycosyltransferase involved in cell wall biosynthesis
MFERSNGVIFFSEHSRKVVMSQFPRIRHATVIPHGVEDAYTLATPRSHELPGTVRLLYVSPVYHYKHQCEVLKAVDLLRRRSGRDLQLRLVGGGSAEDLEEFKKVMRACRGEEFCTHLPFVTGEEVIRELREADLFVFASSCETFGITVLEAMASRLPIACSNRSGLPEILGDGGVYFDPAEVESIAAALDRLMESRELRQGCAERAYLRASSYTWERSARATAEYLREIAAR